MSGQERRTPHTAVFTAGWPDTAYASLRDDAIQGLRVLLLLNNARRWVHTRAESVHFYNDRLVHRRVSVDFTVPDSSPILERSQVDALLIPLTLLQKNTLINFDLRDEAGDALSVLSIRQTQALTYAMLHAWCRLVLRDAGHERIAPEIATALQGIASLTHRDTVDAWRLFRNAGPADGQFHVLYAEPQFRTVLNRFANSFVLVVPLACPVGIRRTLKFSYDEPLSLRYFHTPPFSGASTVPRSFDAAAPDAPVTSNGCRRPVRDAVGLSATPVRFPIPAAEHCQDYYFEVTAPEGTQIERASLIADRCPAHDDGADSAAGDAGTGYREPANEGSGGGATHVWFDAEAGDLTRVTLHVADVPDGSVCYGQARLRLANDGWIRRSWYVCATSTIILSLIFSAALFAPDRIASGINVALSLFAIIAGGLNIVLASPAHPMEARLLNSLRVLTTIVAVLPLVATMVMLVESVSLVPLGEGLGEGVGADDPRLSLPWTVWISGALLLLAVAVGTLVAVTIHRSRRPKVVRSVWSQSGGDRSRIQTYASFWDAVAGEAYDAPAVIVVSGEGERAAGDEDADAHATGLTQQINRVLHEHGPVVETDGAGAGRRRTS